MVSLSFAIIPQLLQAPQMGNPWRKDEKLIPTLQEISKLVPENESIVSSNYDPVLFYYAGRQIEVPNKVSSYSLLIDYMEKKNYEYLLIIDGQYNLAHRNMKFNGTQFYLAKDFKIIASYSTDLSRLHLYKRI